MTFFNNVERDRLAMPPRQFRKPGFDTGTNLTTIACTASEPCISRVEYCSRSATTQGNQRCIKTGITRPDNRYIDLCRWFRSRKRWSWRFVPPIGTGFKIISEQVVCHRYLSSVLLHTICCNAQMCSLRTPQQPPITCTPRSIHRLAASA